MGDCLWAGKLSHYVTNHPGQLSHPECWKADLAWVAGYVAGKAEAGMAHSDCG